jgi:arylsulfatase A-like enzyme
MKIRSLLLALCAAACGDDDEPSRTGDQANDPAAQSSNVSAAYADAIRNTRVHLDLLEHAHLADVDANGLFIDFGTPARMKYTMGTWRNDWGIDRADGDNTFTRLGEAASMWFHVDRPRALTIRMRIRKVASPNAVVYLNGETLRTVDFRDGIQTYDVPVTAEQLRAGENQLRLRGTETREIEGKPVSLELDWIHVARGDAPATLPTYARRGGDVRAAEGQPRRAWSVDPGTTLSYYVEIPASAKLAFGVGARGNGARASVSVTPFDGEARELWSGELSGGYRDEAVALDDLAGKVVRLDFRTEGTAEEIGWSAPQILVPMPDRERVPGRAKNVVVLTIDTMRANKLRIYNPRTRVRTPILDELAADATVFEAAQSPENWTKPSVASILTSLTPTTHRAKTEAASLPDAALMLSEIYQQAGFETGAFLANGYVSDRFGFRQGWDHYTNYIREERSTLASTVFGEAAQWIEEHKDERFFVYIQTIDPHVPYDPPEEYLRMYDPNPDAYTGIVDNRRTGLLLDEIKNNPERNTLTDADKERLRDLYDGEVTYHDHYLGVFLAKMRELGLYDDMIFVVTSDHGEEFDDHGSWGHGHSIFQELLHVPLVVRWPATEARDLRVAQTVSTLDIAPTVLEASGIPIPDPFEGQSLLGYMRGQPPAGPAVAFSDFLDDRRVIRAGRHKLVVRGNLTWTMFDLEADPRERNELDGAEANPIALRYLRILLGQFLGAGDRGNWLSADGRRANVLPQQDSHIDAEMCRQLQALGYHDDRCDAL